MPAAFLSFLPLDALAHNRPLFFTSYLPMIPLYALISIWEEIGWRGFALPHMQAKYAALVATLAVGLLHGLWHLPAFFITGAVDTTFSFGNYATLVFGPMVGTVFFVWVFNNTPGRILFAILLHAASNARLPLERALLPSLSHEASIRGFYALAAVILLIVVSRGRLSYNPAPRS